jgi:uncharacterized OB-fold protein
MVTGWIDEHIWIYTTFEKENNMLFVKCKSCGQEFAYNPYYCSGVEAKNIYVKIGGLKRECNNIPVK